MGSMASQITGISIVYSIVCSRADQRKHRSSSLLAFVRGIHRWPVNSPHKGPTTGKMFPFDDVMWDLCKSLQWHHNVPNDVSNHRHLDCLFNHLFKSRSKKTPKLRVTGICEGNSPVTSEFPAQRASNAENISIWWRHHVERMMTDWCQERCYKTTFQHVGIVGEQ